MDNFREDKNVYEDNDPHGNGLQRQISGPLA